MARARNIKPSLFKNEVLGVADPLLTLLFESLWCLADRRGRLEDRPLRIKAETFPYRENIDINGYLTDLSRLGFILRYKVNELSIIQIINFEKHQNPHHTEKESELPEYSDKTDGCTLTVKEPLNNGIAPADSLNLIPDSLNTDSPFPQTDSLVDGAENSAPKKTNGSALPKDWVLPKKWGEWALSERPDLNAELIRKEAEKFKDHWLANANQAKAKKSDWEATWRNWIRNAKPDKAMTRVKAIQANNNQAVNDFLGESEGRLIEHE